MNHNLEQIRQDYQNIKIPEALKDKVSSAVNQAKGDMEREKLPQGIARTKGRRMRAILTGGCAGIAAAVLVIAVLANSSASIAHAMEQIPVLGSVVKVVTFREYKHQDRNMEADIKIPDVQIEDRNGQIMEEATGNLHATIEEYTNEIIAAYEADVKASGGNGTQAVDLDYEVVTDNDRLFSLQFHQTVTMAGAAQMEKIYHIDKATGNMITLRDLFEDGADYKTLISDNIKEQMRSQMQQDESKLYFLDSEVPEWDFREIADDVDFYVNQSGTLVIVFDEYEVAPGYMGAVSFEIPTDAVEDIVKEGYLAG